ncbi:ParA-like protein [Piscirickettsia salmonis]|uniref:Chromosome partitinioning protein ParA n=1 Tax=Piscirickettsia salmonis TaxID=1238 RepID=A0A1L6TFS2_PISSA|nr:AAA family ATPase [Piscirickettsia salmonis]ALB21218.1 chromosome partitinioning protein ParA [Piscirickettsia salmonis]ALT18050.1 cobalamin biosynthesis protein CobQ [Piscirickettsia salmonis LF-89 = ATCC VR-1361]ALY01478.1 cobalamin biosynthesis protein CobQ [Piscirickettsia salmonis]AMA40992.1 cobalamin biosynthesis protein CobQ [Piscirickettsia salmonis]AOS36180.1 cobalamin biosynthesis protein CobQ [Piscirickettsia salmonis]
MPIISIGCTKGGVGKSTIATSLVVALQAKGYKTILVDCDSQFSASDWADVRDEDDKLPKIKHLQKVGRIKTTLLDLKTEYDFVIVDTGGHDSSSELRQSLTLCDLVLVPLRPSQHDVNTIGTMTDLIEDAQEVANPDLRALFVLNAVSPVAKSKKLIEIRAALNEIDEITLCKSHLCQRDAYIQTASDGRGVTEIKDKKANTEFNALTTEILKHFKGNKYGIKSNTNKKKAKAKKAS